MYFFFLLKKITTYLYIMEVSLPLYIYIYIYRFWIKPRKNGSVYTLRFCNKGSAKTLSANMLWELFEEGYQLPTMTELTGLQLQTLMKSLFALAKTFAKQSSIMRSGVPRISIIQGEPPIKCDIYYHYHNL